MSIPQSAPKEPRSRAQLPRVPEGDQTLTPDELSFYGLSVGSKLPSGVPIRDSRDMPKSARSLFNLNVNIPSISESALGLYNLVKFGGAPLAEEVNNRIVIHDDPRKAVHKGAMYREHVRYCLSVGISLPFHTYELSDAGVRRYITPTTVRVVGSKPDAAVPHPLGLVRLFIDCDGYKFLSSKDEGVAPFGAWIRPGETPTDALRRQAVKEIPSFVVPDVRFMRSGVGQYAVYQAVCSVVDLPTPNPGWSWVEGSNTFPPPSPTIYHSSGGADYGYGRVNIVLSHSCSGKSTFIKSTTPGKLFIDGDTLLEWPKDLSWLKSKETIRQVNVGLWQQLAEQKPSGVLLYAGDIQSIPDNLKSAIKFLGLVHVPMSTFKSNIEARKASGSTQPTDFELLNDSRVKLLEFAQLNGIPIFRGFREMAGRLARVAHKHISSAVVQGSASVNVPTTMLQLASPRGIALVYNTHRLTFGPHMSIRIHTNEYARYTRMTQHAWKHYTRNLPMFYVCEMMRMPINIELTRDGFIKDIIMKGEKLEASGHMLGAFIWLAFPDSVVCGMPHLYPDFHTYVSMYVLNQTTVTPSLEQYTPLVAYHRWIETLAGVLGSYFAIKILLNRGLYLKKRNAYLWRIYARRVVRSIRVCDRTWYFGKPYDRNVDKRFGPLTF